MISTLLSAALLLSPLAASRMDPAAARLAIGLSASPVAIAAGDRRTGPDHPAVGVAASGTVYAAWGASPGMTDVLVASSHDGGRTFGAPGRVNAVPRAAYVGQQEAVQITTIGDAGVLVSWLEIRQGVHSILVARSADEGRTFTRPVTVATSPRGQPMPMAQRMISDRRRDVFVAWMQGGDLYLARSLDQGGSFDRPSVAADTVCECCTPALAAGDGGALYVAYRNREREDRVRDIYFARSRDRGRTFDPEVRVSDGAWEIDACPTSGPALVVSDDRAYVAWMDARTGSRAIWLAASSPGTRVFGRNVPLSRDPKSEPDHPSMALHAGALTVVWEAFASKTIVGTRVALSPLTFVQPVELGGPAEGRSLQPRLAESRGGPALAWISDRAAGRQLLLLPPAAQK